MSVFLSGIAAPSIMARNDANITFTQRHNQHQSWDESQSGLTQAGSFIVGGLASIATMGAASGLSQAMVLGANASTSTIAAATTFQTMQIGAISAGLTSAASTIAVGAVNGRVDGKALVQNVLMSAATGGISAGATQAAGLSDLSKLKGMDRASGIAQKVGIGSAVDATVDMAVYGKTQRDVLGRGLLKAGLGVAQLGVGDLGVGHGMGGQLVDGGLGKTLLHATVGGVFAEMSGSRFEHGALSGAMAEQMSTHLVSINDPSGAAKIGLATSAVTMLGGGNVHDMSTASNIGASQHEHNAALVLLEGGAALALEEAAVVVGGTTVGIAAKEVSDKIIQSVGQAALDLTMDMIFPVGTGTRIFTSDKSGKSGPSDKSSYNPDKSGGGNNKTPGGNNLGKAGATAGAAEKLRQKVTKGGSLSKAEKDAAKKQYKSQEAAKDKARQGLQGNDKQLKKPTHIYKIYEKRTKINDKFGQSSDKIRLDGKSVRSEKQVRQKNKEAGYDKYDSKIIKTYEDKGTGTKYETKLIEHTRKIEGDSALPGNKNNR